MSSTLIIVLASIGFIAEVAGVVLIVLDIRDSRRQARRILQRNQTIYLAAFSETISGGSATLSEARGQALSSG